MDLQRFSTLLLETPNRGNVHTFLGHPAADMCDVTTVEPGNTYSPGVWTCGVSIGLIIDGNLYTPDSLADEKISWGFSDRGGFPPTLLAAYQIEDVQVEHYLCHLGTAGAEGVDFNRVVLQSSAEKRLMAIISVKENGPAGGQIDNLVWQEDKQTLVINQSCKLIVESPRMSGQVIEKAGGITSPIALLFVDVGLRPGRPFEMCFKTEHGFDERVFSAEVPKKRPFADLTIKEAFARASAQWAEELPARVFSPDPRISQVWESCAYHILAAMELNLPRIGAVNYPIFWMRDGIIILHALDLIGRHDLARIGCDYLAPLDFSGGFGAESDAPGEGIWALVNHARIEPDRKWLQGMFPHIQRRVDWLMRMRRATEPMRALSENRTAVSYNSPGNSILCLAAEHGHIHGRMDGHSPDFYINSWALAGLRQAVWAAQQLGESGSATVWQAEAEELEKAIFEHLLPQYGNDRDPIVTPYPTRALGHSSYQDALSKRFIEWFRANRLDGEGKRIREPLWTYFEAAQIHNAFLLGYKEEAWICLNGMLDDATQPWNISAWIEGPPSGGEGLPFRNNQGARGWLRQGHAWGGNMPHNWTSAEMLAALRTVFVIEQEDGLVLGTGIPNSWWKPGKVFGVQNFPTEFGRVSYTVSINDYGKPQLDYQGPPNFRTAWG